VSGAPKSVSRRISTTGVSPVACCAPGSVELTGHPRLLQSRLLVADVEHEATQTLRMHVHEESLSATARSFAPCPFERTFRPPRITPRPRMAGLVHAITDQAPQGASQRIAQLDEHGRYTVRFLFDTATGKGRTPSSARVRMLQPHPGSGYGMHFPLKPGVEVLIGFIEGDPDRPVIVGAVPNPLTQSPVTNRNPQMNRIETESGVYIRMKDR